MQVAPLEMWIAERSWCGHAAAAASSKLYSYLLPPPFPSDILPQSWTADHCKTLFLKFTWTPNMPGTIVFHSATKPFHAKQQKSMSCTDFSQENSMHTLQHQYISTTGNLHLKPGSTLQKLPGWGVNNTPFWQQSHFMQTIRLLTHIQKT